MSPSTVNISNLIVGNERAWRTYRVTKSMTAGKSEGLVERTDADTALQLTSDIIDMSL